MEKNEKIKLKVNIFKKELYAKIEEEGIKFKSFITLTYPEENYAEKEGIDIRLNLKEFIKKAISKKREFYLYNYVVTEKGYVHIQIITTIDFSKKFYSLRKEWKKIIGTVYDDCFNYSEVEYKQSAIDFLTVAYEKKGAVKEASEKLGTERIVGGSKEFQKAIGVLRDNSIDVSTIFEKKELKIDDIRKQITRYYIAKGIKIEEAAIDEQLTREIGIYSETLDMLRLEDIELFLMRSKSKVKEGYLKFYQFLKVIVKETGERFMNAVNKTMNCGKIKRESDFIKKARKVLADKDGDYYEQIMLKSMEKVIKQAIRGFNYITVISSVGNMFLENEEMGQKNAIHAMRFGDLLVKILNLALEGKIRFNVVDKQSEQEGQIELEDETEVYKIRYEGKQIEVVYDEKWLREKTGGKFFERAKLAKLFTFQYPMYVTPLDWEYEQNEKSYIAGTSKINAKKIKNGGYLLNKFLFKKNFLKVPKLGHRHGLGISKEALATINKIQKIKFKKNQEQLDLLIKYRSQFQMDIRKINELKKKKEEKGRILRKFFEEKKEAAKHKLDLYAINKGIKEVFVQVKELDSELTKKVTINRIIDYYIDIPKEKELYFSYEADFRMRIYPQQNELSPQASKVGRSLLRFAEEYEFNLEEFAYYSVRLYIKIYEFTEAELLVLFERRVQPIMEKFCEQEKEEETVKEIIRIASEPFLFLSACVEYRKYKKHMETNKELKYKTGFPIIVDCSGSGPQIVSLVLLQDEFAKFLNLSDPSRRYDFYIEMVRRFIETTDEIKNQIRLEKQDLKDEEFIAILRKICKVNIMTQLYGISHKKFSSNLWEGFKRDEEKLKKFLIKKVNYDEFIENFVQMFWRYARNLSLFRLREFFSQISYELKKADMPLIWSVKNMSQITVDYRNTSEKQRRINSKLFGFEKDYQPIIKREMEGRNYHKQMSSSQANFIHSLDAFVNMYILTKFKSSIFSNHDAWGIGMGKSEELRKYLKEAYKILAIESFEEISNNFKILLESIAGEKGAILFDNYCKEKLQKGTLDPKKLEVSKFMVYFGS